MDALAAWSGTQSRPPSSHDELAPTVTARGLDLHLSRSEVCAALIGGAQRHCTCRQHSAASALAVPTASSLENLGWDDAMLLLRSEPRERAVRGGSAHQWLLRETGHPVATSLLEAVDPAQAAVMLLSADRCPSPGAYVARGRWLRGW